MLKVTLPSNISLSDNAAENIVREFVYRLDKDGKLQATGQALHNPGSAPDLPHISPGGEYPNVERFVHSEDIAGLGEAAQASMLHVDIPWDRDKEQAEKMAGDGCYYEPVPNICTGCGHVDGEMDCTCESTEPKPRRALPLAISHHIPKGNHYMEYSDPRADEVGMSTDAELLLEMTGSFVAKAIADGWVATGEKESPRFDSDMPPRFKFRLSRVVGGRVHTTGAIGATPALALIGAMLYAVTGNVDTTYTEIFENDEEDHDAT